MYVIECNVNVGYLYWGQQRANVETINNLPLWNPIMILTHSKTWWPFMEILMDGHDFHPDSPNIDSVVDMLQITKYPWCFWRQIMFYCYEMSLRSRSLINHRTSDFYAPLSFIFILLMIILVTKKTQLLVRAIQCSISRTVTRVTVTLFTQWPSQNSLFY